MFTKIKAYPIALLVFLILPSISVAETIKFVVQPILKPETSEKFYAPLVGYLQQNTGLEIKFVTARDFLTYWHKMRKNQYDLILDGPHFTDYRAQKMDYSVLAKLKGEVSYSLISSEDKLIVETDDLLGRPVASTPPPSMARVLTQRLFTNPIRQPHFIDSITIDQTFEQVRTGKAEAGMVPTPLLNNYSGFNVVKTTKTIPHVAFSTSPKISKEAREKLRAALLKMENSVAGKIVLEKLKFPGIEPTSALQYKGYAALLNNQWGS